MSRVGKYEIIRPIASGGMAAVYLGRTVGVGGFERLVALKLMHAHMAAERDYIAMFLDEARLAACIRHPNVVATLDIEQRSDGTPLIVMEYIEGPTLAQMAKRARRERERIPLDVTLKVMVDVLNGLHAAHELRGKDRQPLHLVHRDVSPGNIIVGLDGIARLTDFGVARSRVQIHSTRSGQLVGKLSYLAPEQLRDEAIDRRTDVYAAGIVLWEALVLRRLFTASSEGALVTKLLTGADASPRELDATIPPIIDRVVMQALAMAPDERFETALAFAEALEQAAIEVGVGLASTRTLGAYVRGLGIGSAAASDPPPPLDSIPHSEPHGFSINQAHDASSSTLAAGLAASSPPPVEPRPRTGVKILAVAGVAALAGTLGAAYVWRAPAAGSTSPAALPDTSAARQASPGGEADEQPTAPEPPRSAPVAPSTSALPGAGSSQTATAKPPTVRNGPWPRSTASSKAYRPDDL
jgi:serine/threonine-protein kinase